MPEEVTDIDQALINQVAAQFLEKGWAHIRTGERRSATKARKVLTEGASQAEVEVTIKKEDGFYSAVVK